MKLFELFDRPIKYTYLGTTGNQENSFEFSTDQYTYIVNINDMGELSTWAEDISSALNNEYFPEMIANHFDLSSFHSYHVAAIAFATDEGAEKIDYYSPTDAHEAGVVFSTIYKILKDYLAMRSDIEFIAFSSGNGTVDRFYKKIANKLGEALIVPYADNSLFLIKVR